MKKMQLRKLSVVLLALFLAATTMAPVVSAQVTKLSPSPETDAYMDWAYTMEGKYVPVSQMLEKKSPGYWANLSDDRKTAFSKITTKIPNYHQFAQPAGTKSASAEAPDIAVRSNEKARPNVIIYTADAIGSAAAIPFGINYWAHTTTNYPCPYSLVIADLMRWDGSKWVRQDEATATGYGTTLTEAWDNSFFPPSGYSYATYSQHFGDFPAGAVPPAWTLAWWSNSVYYS
jgi:hypothetical protein